MVGQITKAGGTNARTGGTFKICPVTISEMINIHIKSCDG